MTEGIVTSIVITNNLDGTTNYQIVNCPVRQKEIDELAQHLSQIAQNVSEMIGATIH